MRLVQLLILALLFCVSCNKKNKNTLESNGDQMKIIPNVIDFNHVVKSGVLGLEKQRLVPDADGVLAEIALKFPEYKTGMYYRPFSYMLASGNRMEALWFNDISELRNYKQKIPREDDNLKLGSFMLLQKKNGNYLALLPIVSKFAGNTFDIGASDLLLRLATYGTDTVNSKLPLLAYAESANPYEATQKVWALAKNAEGVKGSINWRSDKEYPEAFKYLGWCTWEHFKKDINEEIITTAIYGIKSSDLPIRWVLIDDGYLDEEHKQLLSFGVDKKKFPNGWTPITSLKDDKLKWMGIWRNFNGYMGGVSINHTMENLDDYFIEAPAINRKKTALMPKINALSADAFYNAMITDTKENGFDIVKVDFQSNNLFFNRGKANPVLGVHFNNQALENNVKSKGLQLLNCIAMQNFNVFNQTYSNVIRSSVDYKTNVDRIDLAIVQNFTNAFWLGHVHWLDQDMFHTSYKETARLMAVSRAISGGPIYLSDETKNIDNTYLKPLMYGDGEIIRTLAPGVPLPESLLQDPYVGEQAFKVIAPLRNKSAIIMAVNLNRDTVLEASVSRSDYSYASGMIQPYEGLWEIPEEGILLYDSYHKTTEVLTSDFNFELETRQERLFQLSPIVNDWSVIGDPTKYLSAATAEIRSVSQNQIVCTLKEPGFFAVWTKIGVPSSEGISFKSLGNGLFEADVSSMEADMEITIFR